MGLESQLCHLPAVWPWANYLASLDRNYKMWVITTPISERPNELIQQSQALGPGAWVNATEMFVILNNDTSSNQLLTGPSPEASPEAPFTSSPGL